MVSETFNPHGFRRGAAGEAGVAIIRGRALKRYEHITHNIYIYIYLFIYIIYIYIYIIYIDIIYIYISIIYII